MTQHFSPVLRRQSEAILMAAMPLTGMAHPMTISTLQSMLKRRVGEEAPSSVPVTLMPLHELLLQAAALRYQAHREALEENRHTLLSQALALELHVGGGLWSVKEYSGREPNAYRTLLDGAEQAWLEGYLALIETMVVRMAGLLDRDAVRQRIESLVSVQGLPNEAASTLQHLYCAGPTTTLDCLQLTGHDKRAGRLLLEQLIDQGGLDRMVEGSFAISEQTVAALFPAHP